jgi:hypothetical protein
MGCVMRIALLIPVLLAGCGTLFSGFKEYCEESVDCADGNSDDEQACMLNIHNNRRVARVYGCEDDYMDFMECMKEDAACESYGQYEYWTADGDCEDDYEDYVDCMSDESSGNGWNDTGSDEFSVMDADGYYDDDYPTGDSCRWSGGCVAPNEPDNEAWCTGLSGEYSADSCPEGYDGVCDIPAGGDYTASATVYYYDFSDAEAACTGAGGTYTAS